MLNLPLLIAAATAGLAGGLHCAGMCSPVLRLLQGSAAPTPASLPPALPLASAGSSARVLWLQPQTNATPALGWQLRLHAGRISLYMLAGAMAGLLGAGSLILQPGHAFARLWFLLANLWLLLFVWRLLPGLLQAPAPRLAALLSWPLTLWARHSQRWQARGPLASLQTRASAMLAAGRHHPFLLGIAWGSLPCGLLYMVLPFALLAATPQAGATLMLVFGLCSLPHLLLLPALLALRQPALRWLLTLALLALAVYGLSHPDMQGMPAWLCIS